MQGHLQEHLSEKIPYKLSSVPPKFTETKRVVRDKLYVLRESHALPTTGQWYIYYEVVSPKGYRPGYFPRVRLRGEYSPSPADLFIINKVGLFSLEREPAIKGKDLKAEMERQKIYKAFFVESI